MTAASQGREPGFAQGLALIALAWVSVVAAVVLGPVLPQMAATFKDVPGLDIKIALVATGPALLVALLSIPFGTLADRTGRRPMLLVSLLLYGVAGTAPFWLDTLDAIVASRFVVGLAEAAIMTSGTALISDYFHGRRRERWLAAQTGVAPIFALLCALAGGLLGGFGWRMPFAAYTLGFLLIPFAYIALWEPDRARATTTLGAGASEADEFNWRNALGICACVVFGMTLFMVTFVQLGFVLTERGVTAPATIGLWGAAITIANPLAAVAFSLTRAPIFGRMMLSFALFAAGFAVLGLSDTVAGAVVGGFIANLGGGFLMPTAITWLLQTMPPAHRGRGAGLWTSSNFLGQFLSPFFILALAKSTGSLNGALVGCAIASALAALAFAVATLRSRNAGSIAVAPTRALLGADPDQLQNFRSYMQAFSAGDLERFPAYYTDDVVFDLGVAPPFHGKPEVIAFYRNVFTNIREQVTIKTLSARADAISASISVLFTAFNDMPEFVLQPLRAGESIVGHFDIVYGLRGGLISTVKVTMIGAPAQPSAGA